MPPFRTPRIVVVGSINMDLVVRLDRMPAPGETVPGAGFTTTPGGKGANQAVAAARLGASVEMIGNVGEDVFGEELLDRLRREGVGVEHVEVCAGISSGIAIIQVDAAGENAIVVVPGANGRLGVDRIGSLAGLIAGADAVLLQLEIPFDTVARVAAMGREAGALTVLDPAPAPSGDLPPALFDVDILSPNRSETAVLTGIDVRDADSARRAASILQDRRARRVVIKMGDRGAFYTGSNGRMVHVPAFPTTVADTTAAGDAFTAALAVGIAEGMPVEAAVRFGCAAGSRAVSKRGAQEAMPWREEVENDVGFRS